MNAIVVLFFGSVILLFVNSFVYSQHQLPDGSILLRQGALIGLKIFPETSQMAVYSYLGVPYAQPPIGDLRFAAPQKHAGWQNRTWVARDYKPICPQLKAYTFDEIHNGYAPHAIKTDENCLFLNIWTPQSALRDGNHSVLVMITGEEQAFDWAQNRPTGLEIAAEGVVVVSIQSRTNVFSWFTLRNENAPGNLGLRDQHMAFEWIKDNIGKFGGNRDQMTLLGHGTSGAANAMLHLTNAKTAAMFARMIFMSGTVYSTYSFQQSPGSSGYNSRIAQNATYNANVDLSMVVAKKLACESVHEKSILNCLRQKSITDLLKAFEYVYEHGNYTKVMGPQVDTYLPKSLQYLSSDPKAILENGKYPNVPILMGICTNEGAFIQELWIELAREGYNPLKKYIATTIIPNIIEHYGFESDAIEQVKETINWRFFYRIPQTPSYLLNAMQRLISETKFETPFLETLERLTMEQLELPTTNGTRNNAVDGEKRRALYVYTFHHSKSIDIRGAVNYFGGASHTADLLFLMGPSLFQQISRRKLSGDETRLCKKLRNYFTNFIKFGTPTPGRVFDAWRPYTPAQRYIQLIGDAAAANDVNRIINSFADNSVFIADVDRNKADIDSIIHGQMRVVSSNAINPYDIGPDNAHKDPAESARIAKNYLGAYETSNYYAILTKINSFWTELLPKMGRYSEQRLANYTNIGSRMNVPDDPMHIASITAGNGAKFKHAFFSMLILVCLLLAVLCVCVYILKKNQRNIDTSFL